MSSMNLDSVLGSNDMGDRLGRDGFKISEDWQPSHVNGFAPRPTTQSYPQQRAQQPGTTYIHQNHAPYAQGAENVGYQQQHPQHQQHQQRGAHGQQQQQHQGGEGYDGGWYPGQMS